MNCRLCGSDDLQTVLDLGDQALTGVFPLPGEEVGHGPLTLVRCPGCTLVQLGETPDLKQMYGDNYGYRSGLNQSMVGHLRRKVHDLERLVDLQPGDVVLDIGSNDGTLLGAYDTPDLHRIGIDPTAAKFREYYDPAIEIVPEFFTAERFHSVSGSYASIITSVAMFYDLENPVRFANDVRKCLAEDGVWHFEQSYLPSMLKATAYDTICHEHLEYYSLTTVREILDRAGLQIVDVQLNKINGGSFAVTARRHPSPWPTARAVDLVLQAEELAELAAFSARVHRHRDELVELITGLCAEGATVMGYGASTKGNVLLQYCSFGPDEIEAIAEVNEDKFGHVTPGTRIPIISETEMIERNPDFLLVLPWHFRDGIIEREAEYLAGGGRLIFPLPEIEIVSA